ncbi:MAG: DHA2 family efflux MFS transporter permease subunit [Phycisphaerae bacterium]|nr:DHA2 family efflux MFS transporter permease subunit [Phycisphaerae bacterium]
MTTAAPAPVSHADLTCPATRADAPLEPLADAVSLGRRGSRRWVSLAFVCLAVVVIVMDGSIVNVALPTLARSLDGASNSRLQWVVDAYILAFAALLLPAGSASDRFGRKRVLLVGLATFAIVSIGAARATTVEALIAWRAFMGLGAAMIFPSTLAILTDDFPEPSLRRIAIAIWAGSSGLGVAIGPVAGGWLLEHFHWGSIFLVNLPVIAVAWIGTACFTRESKDVDHARFDPIGAALAISGTLGLVWGLIEAPEAGWGSRETLVSLGLSALLLCAFVWWERRTAHPMLDMRYFANRRFAGGCLAIAAAFFGLFGFVFMVTQYFQFLHGYDALTAGIRTTPFAGFILLGALLAANAGKRVPAHVTIAAGLALMAAGFAWATRDTIDTSYALMVGQMGVLGTGLGLVNAAATETIMSSLPLNKAGTGSSVNDTLREIGGTLGVAGMGSAFNALYRGEIAERLASAPLPHEAKDLIRSSVGAASMVLEKVGEIAGPTAVASLKVPIADAFLKGFAASCWIAGGAAALGAVCAYLLVSSGADTSDAAFFAEADRRPS